MASSCPGNKKFLTAEASTKAAMRTERAIDEFLNIINVKKFRELNTQWSNNAKERFNIEEPLFMEDTVGGKLKAVPNKRMFKAIDNAKGIFYQEDEVPVSTSSPETITKVKRVIESMGVKLQSLSDYLKGNPNVDARGVNALADLTRGIIAIAEGKEDVALVEETVHIATSMIEQVNPKLITEMISKIGNFKIYNQVLEAYKNNPKYQLPDGKPDIRKIKKEAVDKLIAEVIINQNEGSTEFPELMQEVNRSTIRTWWQKILDWFRGEYRKANINIFEEAAQEVMSGRTGVRYYNDNKLGVDRLFESNPELANAVYEALGFNNYNGISIKLGRSVERDFGKVQNVIISYNSVPITSQDGISGLGEMNVVIKDNEIVVGNIRLPEEYQGKGLTKYIYQAVADAIGLPIVNSKSKGFNQSESGGYIWKNRSSFQPNVQQKQQAQQIYSQYLDTIFPDYIDNFAYEAVEELLVVNKIIDRKC